jgi:hypothetical protein
MKRTLVSFLAMALISASAYAESVPLGPKSIGLAQAMASVPKQLEEAMRIGDRICGGTVSPAGAEKTMVTGTRTYEIDFCKATAFGDPAQKAKLIITEEISDDMKMGALHRYSAKVER